MLFGRMQTAAEIPLHTNGAECDIRRLPLETVDEILPGASGGIRALARRPAMIGVGSERHDNRD